MQLLERELALETLGGWFAEARAGRGRLVLVGGEAGVGKTALVSEFALRHRRAARVLWGACDPLTTPRPLGPLADVAQALGGRLDQLLRDEAPREALFPALLERLRDSRVVTVLVIEDVHWADEATLDLLRFLARRLGPAAALLVVTYRDDEVGPLHPLQLLAGDLASSALVRRLRLAPLSRQAVAVLAGPHGVDPDALCETTGGNPFFVTEVLAAGQEAIPDTVTDAVLARAARLSPAARQVLDAAAVVAPPVETWLLAEAAGATPGHLDECVAAGMLQGQAAGGVGFRHELARLAVERALGPGRRADLHGRALAALLTQPGAAPDPARLAHHADGAGDGPAVLAHAPVAARRAAALGAHRAAAAQYARALRFADGLASADLAELLERYSYECYLTDQLPEATASRERALGCWRALRDRRNEGDTLRWLSRLAWYQGRNADAERAGREAVELLAGLAPGPELAMAYSNLSQLAMLAGRNDEALAWGGRAIELADSLSQTEILVHALNNVGTVDWCQGRPTGQRTLERSLALALAHGLEEHVARAYTNLAYSALNLRRFPLASRYLDEGVRYCTERDLDTWRLYMLASQARADFEQGRWTAATRTIETVLRDPRTAPISRIEALAVLGRLRARRGDPGVWPPLDEALALATVTGELQRLGPVAVARAEAAWLDGAPAAARGVVEDALALAEGVAGQTWPWPTGELAFWLWRIGGPDRLPTGGLPDGTAEPFALQMAGTWEAAAARWRAVGCPYEAAAALADSNQEPQLRAALAELERLGARRLAAAVARKLRELGVRGLTRGPRPATRANPANLTPRELEVLGLLVEGRSNRQIAEQLFISNKTAGVHVTNLLAKLGVHSRLEAAAVARRLGLEQPAGLER
ncbi:MAG TPA: AAA family ATPase [Actinomycetota bacterium]|nr:AAA family ATPase [Actinomycetota bacterium]